MNKNELKEALLKAYAAKLDDKLADLEDELSLTEIEDLALKLRAQVGEAITQKLAEQQAQRKSIDERCPHCGERMRNKGSERRWVTTRSGGTVGG